jgi:hypothetical protein
VTQYNNAGHTEMYTYEPATRRLVCASCIPSGSPPTSDVYASQDGLFMTNDGRAFFTTEDALVHTDTNKTQDVYSYVDGRPQLITPGTGDTAPPGGNLFTNSPGLASVSAQGRDVFFSTFESLVPQDHNGLFLKFYDARSGGGFPAPAESPPCNAADECHGASSPAAPEIVNGTGAALTGGNASEPAKHHKKHAKAKRNRNRHTGKRHKRHRRDGRGGA